MSEIRVDTISEKTSGSGTTVSNLKNPNQPFRNLIINGDMSISQRGTSFAAVNDDDYTLDRYKYDISGTDVYQFTISQSTEVPTGQGFAKSMKFDCTTADASLDADNFAIIATRLEGQNLQSLKKGTSSAESTTLSFWVKSNKTGTYIAELFDTENNRVICKSYTISSSDTWEKKTITFPGDTTGAITNDNAGRFRIHFWLLTGTNFSSGSLATAWESRNNVDRAVGQVNLGDNTSNEWYITGIQFEVGDTATDFEHLPFDVQLQRCMRYYTRYDASAGFTRYASGFINSSTAAVATMQLPVPMRGVPTLETSGTAGDYSIYHGTSTTPCNTTPTIQVPSTGDDNATSVGLQQDVASGLTAGQGCIFLGTTSNTNNFFAFSSEL
tara:strand:- start:217 stop:1368 length:1152 start_codon:yes stop_codon:yes gene_type:complete